MLVWILSSTSAFPFFLSSQGSPWLPSMRRASKGVCHLRRGTRIALIIRNSEEYHGLVCRLIDITCAKTFLVDRVMQCSTRDPEEGHHRSSDSGWAPVTIAKLMSPEGSNLLSDLSARVQDRQLMQPACARGRSRSRIHAESLSLCWLWWKERRFACPSEVSAWLPAAPAARQWRTRSVLARSITGNTGLVSSPIYFSNCRRTH